MVVSLLKVIAALFAVVSVNFPKVGVPFISRLPADLLISIWVKVLVPASKVWSAAPENRILPSPV